MATTIHAEVPDEIWRQVRAFVDDGGAGSVQELVVEALRRYLESHSGAIAEQFIRDDVDWALNQND